jgi:hypothetical protein
VGLGYGQPAQGRFVLSPLPRRFAHAH